MRYEDMSILSLFRDEPVVEVEFRRSWAKEPMKVYRKLQSEGLIEDRTSDLPTYRRGTHKRFVITDKGRDALKDVRA